MSPTRKVIAMLSIVLLVLTSSCVFYAPPAGVTDTQKGEVAGPQRLTTSAVH